MRRRPVWDGNYGLAQVLVDVELRSYDAQCLCNDSLTFTRVAPLIHDQNPRSSREYSGFAAFGPFMYRAGTKQFSGGSRYFSRHHPARELDLWCIHPERCPHRPALRSGTFQTLSSADLYYSRDLREDRIVRNTRPGEGDRTGLGGWRFRFCQTRWVTLRRECHSELVNIAGQCRGGIRVPL